MPKKKVLIITMITVILTLGFSISMQSLLASWTTPTAVAPANNTESPLNTGADAQTKNGSLILKSTNETAFYVGLGNVGVGVAPLTKLDVAGEIRAGNTGLDCTNLISGAMRYNSVNKYMEYCDGTSWAYLLSCGGVNNHMENGICTPNTKSCVVANGIGQQVWNTTTLTYGSCTVASCNSGYTLVAGSCQILLAGGASIYTEAQCVTAGGAVRAAGSVNVCDFKPGVGGHNCTTLSCMYDLDTNAHMVAWKCPTGWNRYQNWGGYSVSAWVVDYSWVCPAGTWNMTTPPTASGYSDGGPYGMPRVWSPWGNNLAPQIRPIGDRCGGTDTFTITTGGYDQYLSSTGEYPGAAHGGTGQVKSYAIMDSIGCY